MKKHKLSSKLLASVLSLSMILSTGTPVISVFAEDNITQDNTVLNETNTDSKENVDSTKNELTNEDKTENVLDKNKIEKENREEKSSANELDLTNKSNLADELGSVNKSNSVDELGSTNSHNPTHTNPNIEYINGNDESIDAMDIGVVPNTVFGQYDKDTHTLFIIGEENKEMDKRKFWDFVKKYVDGAKGSDLRPGLEFNKNKSYLEYSVNIRDRIALPTDSSDLFREFPMNIEINSYVHTENVTRMYDMFRNTQVANPDVSNWNVSNAEYMGWMFSDTEMANPDVSKWDTSNVTDMKYMFANTKVANPDVSKWDTSKVTDMMSMFSGSKVANPDVSKWDTSKVINMGSMFAYTKVANPDVSKWEVSSVTDMKSMFTWTENANPDVSKWNVSNVKDMRFMFAETKVADPIVTNWDTSNTNNMSGLFQNSKVAKPDVANWDTSNVKDMSQMFMGTAINPDVSKWNVSNVKDMSNMFGGTLEANPDVSKWDTHNATTMSSMFSYSKVANPDVSKWNTSNVTNMGYMFSNAQTADPDVSKWDTHNVTTMSSMFKNSKIANPNVTDWDTSKVTNMSSMFEDTNLADPDVSKWNVGNVKNMSHMFDNSKIANPNVTDWDTSKVTNMSNMFSGSKVANPDVSKWNTSNVTNMNDMFANTQLADPDVSKWNVGNVKNMSGMFGDTQIANPDVSNWDTHNVTNMNGMFSYSKVANPDISKWNVSNVTDIGWMFYNSNFTKLDLQQFDNIHNINGFILNKHTPQTLIAKGELLKQQNNQIQLADTTHYIFEIQDKDEYNSDGTKGKGYVGKYTGATIPEDLLNKLHEDNTLYEITTNITGSEDDKPHKPSVIEFKTYDSATLWGIAGVTVGLYEEGGAIILKGVTDKDGHLIVDGKIAQIELEPGNYYFQSIQNPPQYIYNENKYPFTVDGSGEFIQIKMPQYRKELDSTITIQVTDNNNYIPLDNTVIGLYEKSTGNEIFKGSVREYRDSTRNLSKGDYYVKVIQPQEHYLTDKTEHSFTVDGSGDPITVEIGLTREKDGELKFYTTTVGGRGIPGVTVELYKYGEMNPFLTFVTNEYGLAGRSKSYGEIDRITPDGDVMLSPGKYYAKIINVPTEYILMNERIPFEIESDKIHKEPIQLIEAIGYLDIQFVDVSGRPLADGVFGVYNSRTNECVITATTDNSGHIGHADDFNKLTIDRNIMLRTGEYYVRMIQAPKGYIVSPNVYPANIYTNMKSTTTIVGEKLPNGYLNISYNNLDTSKLDDNFRIELELENTDSKGTTRTITTDKYGKIIQGIDPQPSRQIEIDEGHYRLRMITKIDGYNEGATTDFYIESGRETTATINLEEIRVIDVTISERVNVKALGNGQAEATKFVITNNKSFDIMLKSLYYKPLSYSRVDDTVDLTTYPKDSKFCKISIDGVNLDTDNTTIKLPTVNGMDFGPGNNNVKIPGKVPQEYNVNVELPPITRTIQDEQMGTLIPTFALYK